MWAFDGGDIGGDRGDLAVLDGDVAHRADLILAVDDVAALEQQIVILREGKRQEENRRQKFHIGKYIPAISDSRGQA